MNTKQSTRLEVIYKHLHPQQQPLIKSLTHHPTNKEDEGTLTVIDNRTGKRIEVPIKNGAFRATDFKQLNLM